MRKNVFNLLLDLRYKLIVGQDRIKPNCALQRICWGYLAPLSHERRGYLKVCIKMAACALRVVIDDTLAFLGFTSAFTYLLLVVLGYRIQRHRAIFSDINHYRPSHSSVRTEDH